MTDSDKENDFESCSTTQEKLEAQRIVSGPLVECTVGTIHVGEERPERVENEKNELRGAQATKTKILISGN